MANKIPIKAVGKIGEVYLKNELKNKFDNDLVEVNDALKSIKRKLYHGNLQEKGFVINPKDYTNDTFVLDQPLGELYDLPNPHFKKIFRPEKINPHINDSDDEDPLEKLQKEEMENK